MEKLLAFIASVGILGFILWVLVGLACLLVYLNGVMFGFAHGILVGLVSLIPPVGFIEGLLHLLNII